MTKIVEEQLRKRNNNTVAEKGHNTHKFRKHPQNQKTPPNSENTPKIRKHAQTLTTQRKCFLGDHNH